MDVWHLIERDHQNIAQLIHDIPNALAGKGIIRSRERLLGDLIDRLEIHADAVHASLYEPLSRTTETRLLVEELQGEHEAFMRPLAGLARSRRKDAHGWLDAFGDATFLVDQHLHRHTHELLPAARRLLSREEVEHATRMFIRGKTRALKSRQQVGPGVTGLGDLVVIGTVGAALGGLALLAWRSGLFGSRDLPNQRYDLSAEAE
ncbi:MAG: hemerythrin domain-containing protein [Methylobacterium sp.]|uniref:hemerythrin domain-containing protein n=1 Tax=Methylobacterium sp. TaxID=409 RepID=UPI0025F4E9AC|nr:hemerythrin domain-containing protein [Methylobacterium sp.]MBX9933116.1 hemerythrin domain-containing protein [Methylobacterium sp.]